MADSDELAISYQAARAGTPVLTHDGAKIGTLEHVLEVPDLDLFDGVVVSTGHGLRFIDADLIEVITAAYIRTTLDQSQALLLRAPDGPPVYHVDALEDTGDSMHDRLGRLFRRPHWVRE